jgi:hypothetical protein
VVIRSEGVTAPTQQRALKTTLVALLALHLFHALFQGGGGADRPRPSDSRHDWQQVSSTCCDGEGTAADGALLRDSDVVARRSDDYRRLVVDGGR